MILNLIEIKLFRRTTKFIIWTTLIVLQIACNSNEINITKPLIIPIPSSQIITEGHFVINNFTGIKYDSDFEIAANFLITFIEKGSSILINESESTQKIVFIKDETIQNIEGYSLEITPSNIEIKAKLPQGAFYAVQSLRQLLPASFENGTFKEKEVAIQCLKIEDKPQFKYRGMHLDVGRHLFPVDFIKKYIDAIAMLKMNTFHWHLTEDQGWRIEIKKYPKLQEVAAYRNETLIGHYSDQPHQFDGKRYGGFYTQEQIKDIVAYAQERQITIIPEIELPGHSQAAIAAYPELGCTGEQIGVATKWGIFEDIYCPKETTFTFLEDVLDEVMALFPGKYIHIGGDEAPKTRWKNCNHCQQLIKKEGLKDEHELQSYFISRIEKYINSKGKQIIGWDEILEGGLAPNATVMSWRGINGAIEAAKQHHDVILTPGSHCYFDHYQSNNENEPLAIGGLLPLEKVYSFNPIPEELTEEEKQYVLGAQGNVWTEYMPNSKKVEYMVFPRMLAMSEVVWSNVENKDYEEFVTRLEQFHNRLEALDINYANHLYEVDGDLQSENESLSYELKTTIKDKTIRYTVDGTNPTLQSEIYSEYIKIDTNTTIKAAVFNSEKQLGTTFTQELNYHKAVGKKITLSVEPHKSYNAGGKEALINSISGSNKRYGDKEWLGFWGDDVEITIDLGKEIEINSIEIRFYNAPGSWIYAPELIEILTEGELDETKLQMESLPHELLLPIRNDNTSLKYFKKDFAFDNKILIDSKVRYIRIKVPNYGIIPEGKQGAGNKAWTFIDEIIVN